MSAYLVVDIQIHDFAAFQDYEKTVLPIFASAGGKPIAFDDSPTPVEGDWNGRLLIVEFPDKASIATVMASPDYAPWRTYRQAISDGRSVAVAGI